jgi:hypothetical protein
LVRARQRAASAHTCTSARRTRPPLLPPSLLRSVQGLPSTSGFLLGFMLGLKLA